MGRYVDIDKVEWNKHYLAISNGTVVQETLQVDADYLNKLVEDVAPVIHAHWTNKRTGIHDGEFYCSHCGIDALWLSDDVQAILNPYCHRCGAKMDEKVQDNGEMGKS